MCINKVIPVSPALHKIVAVFWNIYIFDQWDKQGGVDINYKYVIP